MSSNQFFLCYVILPLAILCFPNSSTGQYLTDSTVNYFTITEFYDSYYDSLIDRRGENNMDGTGYKDYLRWKWFYAKRYSDKGDLGGYVEVIENYINKGHQPDGNDDSDWKFAGPLGIPSGHSDPRKETGKGMMLSLWINPSDKDHILAGSHHGGLWKTMDGGNNWYPLHDNDPRIHGVNSIAVNPYNYDNIFITCNSSLSNQLSESSAGLFKSIDGGDTWNKVIVDGSYPSGSWVNSIRKVIYHPTLSNTLFLISYRKVFKSNDNGSNWTKLLDQEEYFLWGDSSYYDWQNGFFDIKVAPWDDSLLYISGSEIFEMKITPTGIDTANLSESVFNIGLDSNRTLYRHPQRTQISMNQQHPGIVWFCYSANYLQNDTIMDYVRLVKYRSHNHFELIGEFIDYLWMNEFKFVFTVSGYDTNIFYLGGRGLIKIDANHSPISRTGLFGGSQNDLSWIHVDMRDLVLLSDYESRDTLFIANDGGVSWGTKFDGAIPDTVWHWRNPFDNLENGLEVTEFYGLGLSNSAPICFAGGCQDLNNMYYDGMKWINFGQGDGGEVVFDPTDDRIFYFYEWQNGFIYRTQDRGADWEYIYRSGGSYVMAPLVLDPTDRSTLYYGNKKLIRISEVNNFSQDPIIDTLKDFAQRITDIEVITPPSLGKRYYLSTNKYYPEWEGTYLPSEYDSCIYKSANGSHWTDISKGLNGLDKGFISDIEVNSEKPNQLWVSFATYNRVSEADTAYKVYTSNDAGDSWDEYSHGLEQGVPVYKLKYLPWLERIYAGTDIGVYYRDIQDTTWHLFSNNLPLKIISDLELDEKTGRLYAATYGRGLWQTPVYCHYVDTPLVVNQSVTWSCDTTLDRSVYITSGDTLKIIDCRVNLPTEAKIVVQRGATLILDGATLSGSCNDLWWGVEVWGDPKSMQASSNHGKIVLRNGAVLEQARKAIFLGKDIEGGHPDKDYTGGIVDARNAIFRNNRLGIMLWTYSYDNASIIRECHFENTQLLADGSEPEFFIALLQVRGVEIESCTFECSLPAQIDYKARGGGIYSLDSGFEIKPLQEGDTAASFKNLEYGIYLAKYFEDHVNSIHDSYFGNNLTGIYASGLQELEVYNCEFWIDIDTLNPIIKIYGGLYLDNCSGYFVEDNYFHSDVPFSGNNTAIGLTINNSGEAYNLIYNNIFNSLYIGTLAQNYNRSEVQDLGLKISCNDFTQNEYDIAVTGYEGCEECGIALYQGYLDDPSGNLFSHEGEHPTSDYDNQMVLVNYYHHRIDQSGDTSLSRWIPKWYSGNTNPISAEELWNPLDCVSNIGQEREKLFIDSVYLSSNNNIGLISNDLSVLIDGGNTDVLVADITLAQPDDGLDLRDNLLNKSPYLSDTILIQAISKEDVLPPIMIKEIMVANPQSAKSRSVMQALNNRQNPLPSYMIDEILSGKDSLAHKEHLEAELSYWRSQKEWAMNRLIALYRSDSSSVQTDSIVALLEGHNSIPAKYRLVSNHLSLGDTTEAKSVFTNIPNEFELSVLQSANHQQMGELLDIYIEMIVDTQFVSELDSLQISKLIEMAQFENLPGCYARNLLHFLDSLENGPYYILPTGELKSSEIMNFVPEKNNNSEIPAFEVYPNPARNHLVVEYINSEYKRNAVFNLYSSEGRLVYSSSIKCSGNYLIISTKDWLPGVYFYNFTSGTNTKSGKIIIVK